MTPPATCEDLARRIDYPLLAPRLNDEQVVEGLQLARRLGVAAAIVRPCDIDLAVRTLQGAAVRVGAVCGFPHGTQNTATKLYEARDLLRRGAREIDMVIGASKLLSREFQHVQAELLQMAESCHKEGAILKVILETPWLNRELAIIACRCAERAEADFVSTGTGFAGADYPLDDIRLLRSHVPEEMGVKTEGVTTLEEALAAFEAGAARIGSPAAAAILEAWRKQQSAPSAPAVS
ncbi:MAG: deoxyribose-phosphate aldolase [Acidobacteria bacterium]|nr:deoxyribose-phosphate aldolase [Acidobacteriota bacterium]